MRWPQVAAEACELVSDFGDCASGVVTQRRYKNRDATRAVALVRHLDVVDALELTSPFFDCALDVVLRHRAGLRRIDRGSQPRIMGWIATSQLRGHRDFANELGELRDELRVGRSLVMLDLLPFTVAGHYQLGWDCVVMCRAGAAGDADSSRSSVLSSARDASSNCAEAAFTRSVKAIAQRARSNPLSAPKMPNAVDLTPLGIASDDSHCLGFSVRSRPTSRDSP